MTFFNELQNLMIKYRFRPNRKLGQHFVVNERLVEKLVALAELKKQDRVLEIGPGTGFLTREILKKCRVSAVELDEKLCRLLEAELGSKLNLVCGDFLKEPLPEFNKTVSLPPYFHSSAIMHRLLEGKFEIAVLVFQKEFAEKLVALPGFEEYCALTVLVQRRFEAKEIQRVSPACFFPRPKGESSIVRLKALKKPEEVSDNAAFRFFVKTVFRFKNKNLGNALSNGRQFLLPKMKIDSNSFEKRVQGLANLDKKINLLSVQDFVEAFNGLSRN